MYIYKRCNNNYSLVEYVDSKDTYTVESRILKLLRKTRDYRNVKTIKSKFTGIFTVYFFNGKYAYVVSEHQLNRDGTIKTKK